MTGGELFVTKIPSMNIMDLAKMFSPSVWWNGLTRNLFGSVVHILQICS
jgi:hypothetical protein